MTSGIRNPRVLAGVVAASLVLVGVGLLTVHRAMDFPVYYQAALRAWHQDRGLYDIQTLTVGLHYRYAPVLALLLVPLTLVPLPVATFIWYLVKVSALAMSVHVGVRLAGGAQSRVRVFVVAFLLAGAYVVEEWMTGNAHFLAMSCLVLGLYFVERRRTAAASTCLALAILAKITPALVLPYLAIRRQWLAIAGTLVVLVVLCLAPSLLVGHETNMIWLRDWGRTAVDRIDARPAEQDDSLRGALVRFLAAPTAPPDARPNVAVATVPRPVVDGIWLATCAVILGLLFRTAADRAKPPAQRVFEYPLLVVAALLVSPHNTRIYYCALFFPYVVLAIAALGGPPRRLQRPIRAALWISLVVNTILPAIMPGRFASLAYEALSPFVFTTLLAFALLYAMTRERGEAQV